MSFCVICKVLSGEFEGSFIHRGETCSAFLDINPLSEGHALVVPNDHVPRMKNLDPSVGAEMFAMATRIQQAMESSGLKMSGSNLFLSDGEDAGQEIEHLHIHIVARNSADGIRIATGTRTQPDRKALDELAQRFGESLKS